MIAPIAASLPSVPSPVSRRIDLARRGRHDELHARRHSATAALEDVERLVKIGHSAAGARSEKHHLHRRSGCRLDLDDVVRRMRNGDARRQSADVDDDLSSIRRIGVRGDGRPSNRRSLRQVGVGLRVGTKDRRLGARLDREIREYESLLERKRRHRRAVKLERLIVRALGPELADESERNILRRETEWSRPSQRDLDRLGNAQPDPAADHRRGKIRRPDARREQIERAARDGVTVRADHEIARQHASALGDNLMADPDANLEHFGAVHRRERAHAVVKGRGLWPSTAASSDRAKTRRAADRTVAGRPSSRSSRSPSATTHPFRSRGRRRRPRCHPRARRRPISPRESSR